MSYYRRSGYDQGYDDYPRSERWDRDRFERMSGRSRAPNSGSDSYRYEEEDRYYDRRGSTGRNARVEVYEDTRNSRGYDDRPYYEDDRYSTPRRSRPAYLDEDRYQTTNREVAPYRPKYDREYDDYYSSRPQYSPDSSYDRRPPPRNEQERDVNVNLNVRGPPQSGPMSRQPQQVYEYNTSPRREYYEEEDREDVRIRRERERSTYRRYDDYDDSNDSYESSSQQNYKRGRTRMPKRLVHRNAILQKGYPFEEEVDFFIVRMALRKDQIDEVIKISETYFHEEKLSITISERKALPAPEPAQDSSPEPGPEETEVVETVTTKVIENPTEKDYEKYGKPSSDYDNNSGSAYLSKTSSKNQKTYIETPTSNVRGRSQSRSKELVVRRESSSSSSDDDANTTTLVDRSRNDPEVITVEKDREGRGQFVAHRPSNPNTDRSRSRRRRPSQKAVNAALFSLT